MGASLITPVRDQPSIPLRKDGEGVRVVVPGGVCPPDGYAPLQMATGVAMAGNFVFGREARPVVYSDADLSLRVYNIETGEVASFGTEYHSYPVAIGNASEWLVAVGYGEAIHLFSSEDAKWVEFEGCQAKVVGDQIRIWGEGQSYTIGFEKEVLRGSSWLPLGIVLGLIALVVVAGFAAYAVRRIWCGK